MKPSIPPNTSKGNVKPNMAMTCTAKLAVQRSEALNMNRGSAVTTNLKQREQAQATICFAKAPDLAQATGWEVTLERQKLRAQALADELGSLIEYAARKVLGSHYTNVYSSWTSFRWRFAPYLSQARLHVFTAIKYIGHVTAKLEATILDLVTANRTAHLDPIKRRTTLQLSHDRAYMSETVGSLLGHVESGNDSALQALFFVVIALFLGTFTKQALAWIKIPFTALLLVWGVLLGIGNETYIKNWHYVGPGVTVWEDIEPNFFLSLLLPLIIYSAAISMHWHTLRRCLLQVLLLAGPGVVIGTALTAVFVKYVFPYNWTWLESLLFGAMLSATDPVAVIALLQEVGAEKELRTVIEGESLFNDGSAYVLFLLFHNALQGQELTVKSTIRIWMAAFGSHHISRQVQQPLRIVWEELEFIANTLIFVLTGVIIAGNIYQSEHSVGATIQIQARDYGYAFLLWVVLIAIRAIIFAVCFPILKYTGYGITFRKALVMVWAGLRGAVGLALSLFVLFDGQISDKSFRLLAFFFMGLIAAITIMIQGTTTGLLLQALGLTRRLSAKRSFLNNVMQQVERYGDAHAKMVNHSDVLGPPNWKDISSLASLNAKQLLTRYASVHTMQRPFPYWDPATDVELEASHRHITAERKTAQVRQETRARLLRAVQQTYKDVFERAQIAPAHMYRLRKSADQALDHTDEPVCDWKYLDESCQLPAWLHWLQRLKGLPFMAAFCRQQLFGYLEHSASVMVAFHYAHTDAAQSMLHFDLLLQEDLQPQERDRGVQAAAGLHAVDTAEAAKAKIIQEVIQESKHQLKTAERYLHALRMAYPEVMASIRTKQVAQEMLLVKEAYVHELKASGLMDEAEVEEVIHLVDRQKKRLHFAGSLMHVQPACKELRQMPLFQGLNDQDFAKVTSGATLHLFPAGTTIHPNPAAESDSQAADSQQWELVDDMNRKGSGTCTTGLMLGAPLDARVAAKTVVEAYAVPWALLQSLTEQSQAMLVRVLQLCAAHAALLHGGPLLEQATWMQLQKAFRKAKLQTVQEGQKICPKGSVAHPNASGDLSDDTEHSFAVSAGCVLHGPATFESDGTDVTCLQHAKIFHLPPELLQAVRRQQQQQGKAAPSDINSSDSASPPVSLAQQLTGHIGGTAGTNAADTGHWGKKLHEPSPFLSHDLWSKLGESS
ncbi:hypothetical protein WJX82_004786 [Trebouxia sp. C0006]